MRERANGSLADGNLVDGSLANGNLETARGASVGEGRRAEAHRAARAFARSGRKALSIVLAFALAMSLASCAGTGSQDSSTQAESGAEAQGGTEAQGDAEEQGGAEEAGQTAGSSEAGEETADAQGGESEDAQGGGTGGAQPAKAGEQVTDPSGATITVPEKVETVAVLAPSLTEMVVALGYGDAIEAYDTTSAGLEGVKEDAIFLDLSAPDMEQLVNLRPDLLLVTNMTLYDQENPYQTLIDMGVCVACVPNSDSIADIESDIAFVASLFGAEEKGQELIDEMQAEVDEIAAIGETITDRKSVYFEIAAAPDLYSFGSGVFLNEMLEIIGAENILGAESGWMSVTEEAVVDANPDVILTNVNYIDDPVGEIQSRSGWEKVSAVANGEVYYIDNMASSLPDQNVVEALREMAVAVYPEYYEE